MNHKQIKIIQSARVGPDLLLSGNFLLGQNLMTPEFFIIPINVSVRK
jgi:hypothetical protein